MPDFTKDGTQIDEWAVVSPATQREGAAIAIPDDLVISVTVWSSKVEEVAHDGEDYYLFQASKSTSGDEDWEDVLELKGTAGTADKVNVDVESAAGATQLKVDSTGGASEFETLGDRYFVLNNTIANSEIVKNNGFANDDYITCLDGLTNTQQTSADVFNIVDQIGPITYPPQFRRARVIVRNDDADCDIVTKTDIAKVTEIV